MSENNPLAYRLELRWTDRSKSQEWRHYDTYRPNIDPEQMKARIEKHGDIAARVIPLYARQQPMSNQEIDDMLEWFCADERPYSALVRAVERRHGIGGKE